MSDIVTLIVGVAGLAATYHATSDVHIPVGEALPSANRVVFEVGGVWFVASGSREQLPSALIFNEADAVLWVATGVRQ